MSSVEVTPLAVPGDFPEGEEFVCHVLAQIEVDGEPLGLRYVDTETPIPFPDYFIRVATMMGRGGLDRHETTYHFPFLVETYGPDRRSSKAMTRQAVRLLTGLNRGGSHMGILVDACYSVSADVAGRMPDEDDKVTETMWAIEWRRHGGETVMPLEVDQ